MQDPPAGRPAARRTLRTVVVVVLLAALIGTGAAVLVTQQHQLDDQSAELAKVRHQYRALGGTAADAANTLDDRLTRAETLITCLTIAVGSQAVNGLQYVGNERPCPQRHVKLDLWTRLNSAEENLTNLSGIAAQQSQAVPRSASTSCSFTSYNPPAVSCRTSLSRLP